MINADTALLLEYTKVHSNMWQKYTRSACKIRYPTNCGVFGEQSIPGRFSAALNWPGNVTNSSPVTFV